MGGTKLCVGYAGLGAMGSGMAGNLQKFLASQGAEGAFQPQLLVWNRTASKAEPLVKAGAHQVSSVEDLAERCHIVFSCMVNDAALRATFETYLKAAKHQEGAVYVDQSTVAPKLVSQLAEQAEQKGIGYVSSQIFGRPDAAAAKNLIVLAAGKQTHKQKVHPLLEAEGTRVLDVGEQPHMGAVAKLVGNLTIVSIIELTAMSKQVFGEAQALGEKSGLSKEASREIYTSLMGGHIPPGYAGRITRGEFDAGDMGFPVSTAAKDVGHMRDMARDTGSHFPLGELIYSNLKELADSGRGKLDWGSVALLVREKSDLPPK